jgi:hypothetical protein
MVDTQANTHLALLSQLLGAQRKGVPVFKGHELVQVEHGVEQQAALRPRALDVGQRVAALALRLQQDHKEGRHGNGQSIRVRL